MNETLNGSTNSLIFNNTNGEIAAKRDVYVEKIVLDWLRESVLAPWTFIGIALNVCCSVVILRTCKLRDVPCNHYIAALCLVDSVALLTYGVELRDDVTRWQVWCNVRTLLSGGSGMLRSWLHVLLIVKSIACTSSAASHVSGGVASARVLIAAAVTITTALHLNISVAVGMLQTHTGSWRCVTSHNEYVTLAARLVSVILPALLTLSIVTGLCVCAVIRATVGAVMRRPSNSTTTPHASRYVRLTYVIAYVTIQIPIEAHMMLLMQQRSRRIPLTLQQYLVHQYFYIVLNVIKTLHFFINVTCQAKFRAALVDAARWLMCRLACCEAQPRDGSGGGGGTQRYFQTTVNNHENHML